MKIHWHRIAAVVLTILAIKFAVWAFEPATELLFRFSQLGTRHHSYEEVSAIARILVVVVLVLAVIGAVQFVGNINDEDQQ